MVLFAHTFGELIIPQTNSTCLRNSALQSGHDLLAVPYDVLKDLSQSRPQRDRHCGVGGCIRISDYTWWHSFSPATGLCSCDAASACSIYSEFGSKAIKPEKSWVSGYTVDKLFEDHPNGAAIIGRPARKLQKKLIADLRTAIPGQSAIIGSSSSENTQSDDISMSNADASSFALSTNNDSEPVTNNTSLDGTEDMTALANTPSDTGAQQGSDYQKVLMGPAHETLCPNWMSSGRTTDRISAGRIDSTLLAPRTVRHGLRRESRSIRDMASQR